MRGGPQGGGEEDGLRFCWARLQGRGEGGKKLGRGLGKREEGDGLCVGFDSVGPVSFFSLLLVQAPMHFIHFFQFFNPYKITKNNIKIAN